MIRATLLASLLALAACGPGRTSAATQPTPAAFDPSQSDADAIALVDQAVAEVAGPDAHATWDKVQQLTFTAKYVLDGDVKGYYVHHWDRWNGRHNFQSADLAAGGEEPPWIEVYYDLFDEDAKIHGSYDGNEVVREDAVRFRKEARTRLADDGYMLAMLYKLQDPGVKLTSEGEIQPTDGVCTPACKTVKVTFDPAVGKDTWYVNINTATAMPEVIEKLGPSGRIGFRIDGWVEAGGLKFPSKLQNIGLAGEVFEFSEIAIGEPEDKYYIPQVTGD